MPCGDGEKSGTLLRFAQKYEEFMKFKNDTPLYFLRLDKYEIFLRGTIREFHFQAVYNWLLDKYIVHRKTTSHFIRLPNLTANGSYQLPNCYK